MNSPATMLPEIIQRQRDKSISPMTRFILNCLFILAQNSSARTREMKEFKTEFHKFKKGFKNEI
jgi:hypothetical protein